MSLSRRLNQLERQTGYFPRIVFCLIAPDQAADPPGRFPREAALEAWCDEHGRQRPLIVVRPPGRRAERT